MNETLNEISPTLPWKPDAFANRRVIITGEGEELEATKAEFPTADTAPIDSSNNYHGIRNCDR
jgi:hypothetical protein